MLPPEDIQALGVFHQATQSSRAGEVVLRCGNEIGRVFFSGGRIAWATVSTIKMTLTEFLIDYVSASEEELTLLYEECSLSGSNFAETVVAKGFLDVETMRRLLGQQLAEALLEMFSWRDIESNFVATERNYDDELTFSFDELIQAACALDTAGKLPFTGMAADELLTELRWHAQGESEAAAVDAIPGESAADSFAVLSDDEIDDLDDVDDLRPPGSGGKIALVVVLLMVMGGAGAAYLYQDELLEMAGLAQSAPTHDPQEGPAKQTPTDVQPDEGTDAGVVPDEPGATQDPEATPDEPAQPDEPEIRPGIVAFAQGAGVGKLRVASKPGKAKIYLDGVYTGKKTPHTFKKVAARDHVVMVERRGYKPAWKKVSVASGKRSKMRLKMRRSRKKLRGKIWVTIESDPPKAQIFLNGRRVKKKRTPARLKLPAGKPTKLEVRVKGRRKWIRTVRPVPGEKITILAR